MDAGPESRCPAGQYWKSMSPDPHVGSCKPIPQCPGGTQFLPDQEKCCTITQYGADGRPNGWQCPTGQTTSMLGSGPGMPLGTKLAIGVGAIVVAAFAFKAFRK